MVSALFAAVAIVTNGVSASFVLANQFPTLNEQKAAMELRYWLNQATRGGYPVFNVPRLGETAGKTEIVPTTLEHGRRLVPAEAVRRLEASDSKEAFVICTRESAYRGPGVYIVGKTDIGTLYGAYAFLEDYVGIRFFHAGPCGTYVPKRRDIVFDKPVFDFREPKVDVRRINVWYGSVKPLDKEKDVDVWLTRRALHFRATWGSHEEIPLDRLQHVAGSGQPWQGGGETMLRDGVPLSLFETHPEYFPLVKGERSREAAEKQMRRCLSNPEVKKLAVKYALRCCTYSPSFIVDYRDTDGGWCECTNCVAYGTGKDGGYSVQNAAHRFSKEVTDAILKVMPEAELQLLIYRNYREPVSNDVVFDKRVHGHFCPHQRCYAHALDDPECVLNGPFLRKYDFWRTRCPGIGFFDYYCYSDSPYCPVEWVLEKDFKTYFARDGFHCWIEDCSGGSAEDCIGYILCNWQMYYLASKLMWDPALDAKKLFDEGYSLYYGPAAKPMKEYHAYRKALWDSAPGHCYMSNYHRWHYVLGVEGAETKLKGLLGEAERLAANDKDVKTRVGLDRKLLDMFWGKGWEKVKPAYRMRASTTDVTIDVPPNGDFRMMDKDGFPKDWGSDKKKFENGAIVLDHAVTYVYAALPDFLEPTKATVEIVAAGKGVLSPSLRYCIRNPGDPRPMKQEETLDLGKLQLTDKMQTFRIETTIPAHSRHYFFAYGNDARISSVRIDFASDRRPQKAAGR